MSLRLELLLFENLGHEASGVVHEMTLMNSSNSTICERLIHKYKHNLQVQSRSARSEHFRMLSLSKPLNISGATIILLLDITDFFHQRYISSFNVFDHMRLMITCEEVSSKSSYLQVQGMLNSKNHSSSMWGAYRHSLLELDDLDSIQKPLNELSDPIIAPLRKYFPKMVAIEDI
ncbi:hypothetical protein K492DRAFT_222930 [Lichtheimia hyalospora FSU 10163]|nr:hypothetical protein K492DRAFT_222930 [Lichtheimia hyalospora FSU 10163]